MSHGFESLRSSLSSVLKTATEMNKTLQDGEWDTDPGKEREA